MPAGFFSLDVSPAVWQLWGLAALTLVVLMAVESDLRAHRIPNVVVLLALVSGLALHAVGPANGGAGLLDPFPGALGAGPALLGALVGLLVFLPFYLLRAMGAGDVKLLAGLGAYVGAQEVVNVALSVLVAGGLLAVARMAWTGRSRLVLSNVKWALTGGVRGPQRFDPLVHSAERMPYALAFASGTAFYVYWRLLAGGASWIRF